MRSHMRLFWIGVAVGAYIAWRNMPRCEEAQQHDVETENAIKAGRALKYALRQYSDAKQQLDADRTNDAVGRLAKVA